jgi:hypothetical protein
MARVAFVLMFAALAATGEAAGPARGSGWLRNGFFLGSGNGSYAGATLGRWARYEKDRVIFDDGLTIQFAGADPAVRLTGIEPLSASPVFLISGQTAHTDIRNPYAALRYHGVYPGVDVVCRIADDRWKMDFVIGPGAAVAPIRLRYLGSRGIHVSPGGELRMTGPNGRMLEERIPATYQVRPENGEHLPLAASYRLFADGTVGFSVRGTIDPALPVVIDPALQFSSYWGGNGDESITAVAFGSDDSVFVAGWTLSSNLPVANSAQNANRGATDGFVAKLSRTGQSLIWATFFGGSGDDRIQSMVVDSAGRPVVAGWTSSSNFPLQTPLKSTLGGASDAFVARVASIGSYLEFSTYYGGSAADSFNAVAVDSSGIYLGGQTLSSDFPTLNAAQSARAGGQDGTLVKLDASGVSTLFSSYFGGAQDDAVNAVAVCQQQLFAGGATLSSNLPVSGGTAYRGGMDGFLVRLNAAGSAISGSTYVGGTGGSAAAPEAVNAVQVTSNCEAVAGGVTPSSDFPVLNGAQPGFSGGGSDGFVVKYAATSFSSVQWSTLLGGSGYDSVLGLVVRPSGQVIAVGTTGSGNFPLLNPVQATHGGMYDAFVTVYQASGSVAFSTFWGGAGSDAAYGAANGKFDGSSILIGGSTGSANFPVSAAYMPATDTLTPNGFFASFTLTGGAVHPRDKAGYFRQGGFALDKTGDFSWNAGDTAFPFGMSTDIPVAGDWTGNGQFRVGVFRGGVWYVDINGDGNWTWGVDQYYYYGIPGDLPVVGDWTGDGRSKIGVYRPSTGVWYLDYDGNNAWTNFQDRIIQWGAPDDLPVVGDWTGSGASKIGLYKTGKRTVVLNWADSANPSGTTYSVYRAASSCSGSPSYTKIASGIGARTYTDGSLVPGSYCYAVTASYNGQESARSTAVSASFTSPTVNWLLDTNGDFTFTAGVDTQLLLGTLGDLPAAMNLDLQRTEPVLFRPSTGAWISVSGILGYFGYPGDVPIVGPWQ